MSAAVARSTPAAAPQSKTRSRCIAPNKRCKRVVTTSSTAPFTKETKTGSSPARGVVAVSASTPPVSCKIKDDLRNTCDASGWAKKPCTNAIRFLFSSRGFVDNTRKHFGTMPMKCIASMRSKLALNVKKRVTVGCESTRRSWTVNRVKRATNACRSVVGSTPTPTSCNKHLSSCIGLKPLFQRNIISSGMTCEL